MTRDSNSKPRMKRFIPKPPVLVQPTRPLTYREVQVITQTAYGDNRAEISSMLGIKRTTVKAHLDRARLKLNARNRTHAVTVALVLGLINPYPQA